MIPSFRLLLPVLLVVCVAVPVAAQTPAAAPAPAQSPADDPDLDPNDAQPDFYVATMPTTLRLPKGKLAFRLTHRFLQPLGDGDFSDLAARLFGFDSSAQIGLDLKYGLFRGTSVGVYRTSDRTVQFSGQYDAVAQANAGFGLGINVSIDGTGNFTDDFSPGAALVLSRELGEHGALYFEPSYVSNVNIGVTPSDEDYTIMTGIGARLRAAKNTYLFLELSPRVAGYKPGVTLISFGFEQRAGGHLFQLNFSNGYGTTLAQVARGGTAYEDWYLGFNLARKFF
jgi:hypothetical protein